MTEFSRYEKQMLFAPIGLKGQKKLCKSKVGILGVGATGTNIANLLSRSGIGHLVLVDSDRIELSNLHRQMLFSEDDIGKYKASTAAEKIAGINSDILIEGFTLRVGESNFNELFNGCDLIMDATDNFATRFMLNKMTLGNKTPWIHTGVTAAYGQSMLFCPGKTACFGCLAPETVEPQAFPTVHNSGILNMTVTILASISCATALKFLVQHQIDHSLVFFDVWRNTLDQIRIDRNLDCPHCQNDFSRRKQ